MLETQGLLVPASVSKKLNPVAAAFPDDGGGPTTGCCAVEQKNHHGPASVAKKLHDLVTAALPDGGGGPTNGCCADDHGALVDPFASVSFLPSCQSFS